MKLPIGRGFQAGLDAVRLILIGFVTVKIQTTKIKTRRTIDPTKSVFLKVASARQDGEAGAQEPECTFCT